VVEDDDTITGVLERHLTKWGYLVQGVRDFSNVLEQFLAFKPHLTLLDISLPFYSGYHWCEEIRKASKSPILFLSSAGDDMNQVMALSLGADGFVVKPFSLEVVTAKIQALLRRAYSFGGDEDILTRGDISLNLREATLSRGASSIELTRNEFRILEALLKQAGKTVSREALMMKLWETDSFIDDNTLTVNMARLRKKLESIGLAGWIITKKGWGYLIL
jgi:DNA-binding response OmpR family regulator